MAKMRDLSVVLPLTAACCTFLIGQGLARLLSAATSVRIVLVLLFVTQYVMPLVSIRLPDDLEALLAREAARAQRPKSEIARDAIADYLERIERERFLSEIARAARARGDADALAVASEALYTDNEALATSEDAVHEPKARYRARNPKTVK